MDKAGDIMAIAVSFFAGAGGLDLGIKNAGFDIKLAVELMPTYCETLRNNFPGLNVKEDDIMTFNKVKLHKEAGIPMDQEIDLMMGGSPCQSFSTAGNRKAFSDPRGMAMLKFAELVSEVQPKMFLLENVRGLLSASLKHRPINQRGKENAEYEEDEKPGSVLKYLLSKFKGYTVEHKLVIAADYGVPQTRERVLFVGVRDDLKGKFVFPEPTHSKNGIDGKKAWVTFGDLLKKMQVTEHHYQPYNAERLRYMKMIPEGGGNWRDLYAYGEQTVRDAMNGAFLSGGGKVGFFRRISVNKPAPTVLTSPNQKSTNLGHPFEDRPLSIEEYIAIQEFPPNFKAAGTLSQQYVQFGNAVPVRLATVMGEAILKFLQDIESSNNRIERVAING